MVVEHAHIGRRVREIRTWRDMSLSATAGLAGLSVSYLSMIERGQRAVTKRAVLEAIAAALRVPPTQLTAEPETAARVVADAAMAAFTDVLSGWWIGEVPDCSPRPLPELLADVRMLSTFRAVSDYESQATMLPGLIRELLVTASRPGGRDVLVPLISAYWAVGAVAGRWNLLGLPALATDRIARVAERLEDPVWIAAAAWMRAHMLSGTNRSRQYDLAVAAVDMAPAAQPETRGMSHLTAALAAAAQGQADVAETHLNEAADLAERLDVDVSPWALGMMNFGRTNVGIWRVSIGVELGHGPRDAAIAPGLEAITPSRQGAFWIDYGRALLAERKTRDAGAQALLRAEQLVPQQVRSNVWVREAVTNSLAAERRAAGGRELRGLAMRLGVAPTG